jgi:hypothetical protein
MFLLARRILNFIAAALLQQVTLFPRDDDTAATTVSSISTTSPPTATTSYYELLATEKIRSIIQDTASSYTRDKSQAELIFVSSVIIAVFVFVIVLPVLEAYFLRDDNDEDVEEQIRRYYSNVSRHQDVDTVNKSPPPQSSSHQHTTTMMRVYQPGQGVVEMSIDEVIEMTALLRECSSSLSSSSSTGTAGSMETIYEEEEEEVDENDDELDSLLLLPTPTSSPPLTPETKVNNSTPRFIDEEFKRRLFQSSTSLQLPPLSSSSNHLAPQ